MPESFAIPSAHPSLVCSLLGPDRRRAQALYSYRLIYWEPDAEGTGCVMSWLVTGGRLAYQLDLEQDDAGRLRLHCTCADAIYRAEEQGSRCKHARGLLESLGELPDPGPLYQVA